MTWQIRTLGDLVSLQRGYDLPEHKRRTGSVPVYGSAGINGYHDTARAKGPGVTVGRSGASFGVVHYSPTDYWPHNTVLFVTDFRGNDPRFAYYILKNLDFNSFNSGSAQPSLNRNYLYEIPIRIPSIRIQQAVADILSAYDDLIENNTRRIAILEEMAQAIYREWFVKFRFPGHEQMEMVESELGLIPAGWEVKRLSELVSTQYGYTESAQDRPVGPKFVRGTDINKASYIDWASVPYCPIAPDDFMKYRVDVGDIFVIRMADPGKVGIVEKTVEAVFASYLIRLKITSGRLSPYYLFYFLSSDRYQDYVTGASTGTTRKSASAGVITDIDLVIPSDPLRQDFEKQISDLRRMLGNLLERNNMLRQTRDLLLPKLISGEIDVEALDLEPAETFA